MSTSRRRIAHGVAAAALLFILVPSLVAARGSSSETVTPGMNLAMQQYFQARNATLEYVLAAKKQLRGHDLNKVWRDYVDMESKANSWIQTIALDIQTNTPMDSASQEAFKLAASEVESSTTQLAADIEGKVDVAAVLPSPSPGTSNVGFIPKIVDLGSAVDLIKLALDWGVKHRQDLLQLRQKEQAYRDVLATQLRNCQQWPMWDNIGNPAYKDLCNAPIGPSEPEPVPSSR